MKSLFTFFAALMLSGAALAQTTPATPPAAQPAPAKPALSWPPILEVGQRWVLTLEPLGQWEINLSAKDKDGDPIGTAKSNVQGGVNYQTFFYYLKTSDITNLYLSNSNGSGYLCQFTKDSVSKNPLDVTMIGAAYVKAPGKPFEKLESICLVSWVNSPAAPLSIQPTTGTVPTPAAPVTTPPVATTPPVVTPPIPPAAVNPTTGVATDIKAPQTAVALVWPPKIEVKQSWLARISNLSFDITLQTTAAGIVRGTAKRGAANGEAFMFYNSSENRLTLELNVGADQFICSFDLKGIQDKAYTGTVIYRSGTGVARPLTEKCALFRLK